jgi:hypothetical protein
MSTPMLFEKYPYLTPLGITSTESRIQSESLNLRLNSLVDGSQRFDVSVTVKAGKGQSLHADLMQNWLTYGMETPFEIDCPQPLYTEVGLSIGEDVLPQLTSPAGTTELILTSTQEFGIPSGRFVTFSNHKKVYAVISCSTPTFSIAGWTANLKLKPGLQQPITSTDTLELENVKMTVKNAGNNSSFQYTAGIIQSATLEFKEDLN